MIKDIYIVVMQKQIGAIFLVAGTCIGSGMIALPLVLAKLGIIPSVGLMLIICIIGYYSALVSTEIGLQAACGLPLGRLAKIYSGSFVQSFSVVCFKLLTYALLAVFIYGGSSILQKLFISNIFYQEYDFKIIATWLSIFSIVILLLPIRFVDYVNRVLFLSLIGVVLISITFLFAKINWSNLPLFASNSFDILSWRVAIPVVFTSFGFHVIFHTLINYCDKDVVKLKRAFFYGILISAMIYLSWTIGTLSVIYDRDLSFYQNIVNGKAEVGDLVSELSKISNIKSIQLLVWVISFFAIITSLIGVGIGLKDSVKDMISEEISDKTRNLLSAIITVSPAYLIAILVPNAFIAVLGFAGMILVFIAILIPLYLFWKMKERSASSELYCVEIYNKFLNIFLFCAGIVIIICEVLNIVMKV